jgi:hypothetical protein
MRAGGGSEKVAGSNFASKQFFSCICAVLGVL